MTRPTVLPSFATDATLTAGPQAGLSPRLDPGAGVRAQGFYQDRRLPARAFSYLLGILGDWVGYIDGRQEHDAFCFHRNDLVVGTSQLRFLTAVQQTTGVGSPGNRQVSILTSGNTAGSFPAFEFLNDGTAPGSIVNFGGGGVPTSAPAADASGVFFWGATGGGVKSSSNAGASSATVTVTGASTQIDWVGCTAGHYLAFETSTQKLYVSTALGGTWSNTVILLTVIQDLITNGSGTWILVGNISSAPAVYYSTDDGATWTFTSSLGSGASSGCYSANDGMFYVLTSQGKLWSSPNGVAWSLSKTMSALTGLAFAQNTFVSCGPALACVVNRGVNSLGKYPYGIAYTLDAGSTWNEIYIGNPSGSNPIANLISANGRLYAIDGAALYRSGVMVAPPSLFTGV